jgi:type IV pilus assembly protein PilW
MRGTPLSPNRLSRQRGFTLVEFMISIALGMILVAALSVLIANQSENRSEIDRTGRMIENGRYATQAIVEDLQMAGYWGEISRNPEAPTGVPTLGTTPGTLPDPCSVALNSPEWSLPSATAASPGLKEGTLLHVQGYDGSIFTSTTLSCVTNWKSGTDVLVVRRADPDFSALLNNGTPPVIQLSNLTDGQVYVQTGLLAANGTVSDYRFFAGASASNSANFPLLRRDGTFAPPRKVLVHIYYVATCDVCTGPGVDTIPTLKRVELGVASGSPTMGNPPVAIAEGVEDLQIDYGVDDPVNPTNNDGAPNGSDVNAADTRLGSVADNWRNAMSARIYLLARSTEKSPGFTDTKSYCMGTSYPSPSSCYVPATADASYQRHLFTQSVRMTNPSLRRSS